MSEVVQDLQKDLYVDNWLSGADRIRDAGSKYKTTYDMAEANMSLENLYPIM